MLATNWHALFIACHAVGKIAEGFRIPRQYPLTDQITRSAIEMPHGLLSKQIHFSAVLRHVSIPDNMKVVMQIDSIHL